MQFINDPRYSGIPMDMYNGNNMPNQSMPMQYPQTNQPMQQMQKPKVDPKMFETPEITMGETTKPLFSTLKSNPTITVDNESDVEVAEKKKKRGRKPKDDNLPEELVKSSNIVPSIFRDNEQPATLSGTVVEDTPTSYTYYETTGLLKETLGQIDAINGELVQEFAAVRHNRTMKNKYNTLVGLSENIGSLIGNRIAVIREINNSISKSNDLDYKKFKDSKAAQAEMNDDKYIADLYKSFMSNPTNSAPSPQVPQVDSSIFGSGIVRADLRSGDITGNGPVDLGYMNYMTNLSPEQNLMRYENDPDVKQVIIYDAQSGNRQFQYINTKTGVAIPNMPVYDQFLMEGFNIDLKNKIAKSLDLNETMPVVVINDNITSQY